MDKIIVTISGSILIILIYWFFFGKKEKETFANGNIDIVVDGGYNPSVIKLRKGEKATLLVTRKDTNSCLEEIIFPDFKIKKYLPLNETVEIEITPSVSGEFSFNCGMSMYHGKVIVE